MFGKTDTPSSAPVAATAGHGLRVSGSAELGTGCIFGFHLEAALPLLVHVIAFNDEYAWGMDVSDTDDVACKVFASSRLLAVCFLRFAKWTPCSPGSVQDFLNGSRRCLAVTRPAMASRWW